VWLNLQLVVSVPYEANERVVMQLDFTESEEEEEDKTSENNEGAEDGSSGPLTNVAANANQEKTTYTNQSFSKSKADQEVLDELKRLESEEFNSIAHSEEDKEEDQQEKETIDKSLIKEEAEKNDNASYGNDVKATANYYLPNRKPQRKPTPSYKCKSQGVVTVIIKVNQKGSVSSTSIDESKTNTDSECLRSEALIYAKRWRFTQDFNDETRKEGWIKFTYASQ
jgi:TonB family protein